jgi:lipid-A-disaccharide synthase
VKFVGHPLADTIPMAVDKPAARKALGLPAESTILAMLPGSRSNELHYLASTFIETVRWLRERHPGLQVVVPLANEVRRAQFEQAMAQVIDAPEMTLVDGQSREVMAAADVVLLASGTAALEAMLLKRPMVVAYKLSPLTYWLAKRLVKVENVSLPNLLANETLVPELIQHEATPEKLGQAVLNYLENMELNEAVSRRFDEIHQTLRQDASRQAANAVLDLVG